MRARALLTTLCASLFLLIAAVPAFADLSAEGGEGAYGKADDIVVTNFGFGLMIFFVVLVTVLSIGQYLLTKRKYHK